jgi:choice-of-anchor A domain-containing protein
VVFNFRQATRLTVTSGVLNGMLWAPSADVTLTSTTVNGTLLGRSLQGRSGVFSLAPFLGPLP